jgi:hypothetical protein
MKWQDLVTTYWSQVILVLLAVSYFIKRIFDEKSKKIEITYSLFLQNRINTVNLFFANYAKVESMWHKVPYWDVIDYKIKSDVVDKIVWPPLNDLKQSVLELKMYFKKEEHKYFEVLLENILSINSNLLKNRNDYSEQTLIQKANDFIFYKEKVLMENSRIIDDLTTMIRKTFNHK